MPIIGERETEGGKKQFNYIYIIYIRVQQLTTFNHMQHLCQHRTGASVPRVRLAIVHEYRHLHVHLQSSR